MVRKIIGYYAETETLTDADQLVMEISRHEVACLVKSHATGEIEGFELFRFEEPAGEWSDVFHGMREASRLLGISFSHTHCYYNFEQALLVPASRFTEATAKDFLNLVYGESLRHQDRHEAVREGEMINAYRVDNSLHEWLEANHPSHTSNHAYTALLNDIFNRTELAGHFVKVIFYNRHIVVAVVKNGTLQIVQSFAFEGREDILYHLSNINEQFGLDVTHSHLEISGMFDNGSVLHRQLQSRFGLITFDTMNMSGIFKAAVNQPQHYFTPFYKLVV